MEWIPRNDISKLPTDDYCQVLVNLQTPTRLETTVMNYYPDEKDEEGNIGIEHSFSRNPPQSWDDNFTHYCIFPDPCVGKKDDTGTRQLTIPDVSQQRELLINFKRWEYKNNICYDDTCDEAVIDRYLEEN